MADAEVIHELSEQFLRSSFAFLIAQPVSNVAGDGQMGKQGIILIHDADAPLLRGQAGRIASADGDGSSQNGNQSGNGFKQDGFPGAGGAHKHEKFPLIYGEIDVFQAEFTKVYFKSFDVDHVAFFCGRASTLRARNSERHTRTSHTATG